MILLLTHFYPFQQRSNDILKVRMSVAIASAGGTFDDMVRMVHVVLGNIEPGDVCFILPHTRS